MYSVISPAKRLDFSPPELGALPHTEPPLLKDTATLHKTARNLSQKKIRELMDLSVDLGKLTHQRFQDFDPESHHERNALQAILAFNGDVYVGLEARTLGRDDLAFAQDHVGILSGLYGLLRPLDLMQPYRLEMGTSLSTRRGKNLYDFWGDRVSKQIRALMAEHDDRTVINVASNEYWKVVREEPLAAKRIITPVFRDIKDGKSRTVSFLAKKARGMMVRWIIENRTDDPEGLKAFDGGGYAFQPDQSDDDRWVFERQQPTPG